MEDYRTVKNTSGVPQNVIYKGKQFLLSPFAEDTFSGEIARLFLERCAPIVVDTTENLGSTYAPDAEASTVWIANVTGNPDAPDTVTESRLIKGTRKHEDVEVTNPNKKPRTLSRVENGGHLQYMTKSGLVQKSLASKVWDVPPFRRRSMPKGSANWFIGRDGTQETGRGAAIVSRAPSVFEPDINWGLDDMRTYMTLTDPTAPIGPSEATLKENNPNASKFDMEDLVRVAKAELFKRLYFRLVDPRYRLPTRAEFNEYRTGKSQADLDKEKLDELLNESDRVQARP